MNQSLDNELTWLTEKVAAAVRDLGKRIRELQQERFVETVDIEGISELISNYKGNTGLFPKITKACGTEYLSKRVRKKDA